jgi:hypothetical protein
MAVEYAGDVVGVQSLEADYFATLRTVDSGSWLVPAVRGAAERRTPVRRYHPLGRSNG